MANQVLEWVGTFVDQNDVTTELSLGTRFTISVNANCLGVQIRIPSSLPSAPSPAIVSVWNILDTLNPLEEKSFEWSTYSGNLNSAQDILFDTPLALVTGQTYVAVVQTYEKWQGISSYPWPLTSGILTAISDNGWVHVGFGYPEIENGSAYSFGVSPVIEIPVTEVSTSFSIEYNTTISASKSVAVQYDVRAGEEVSTSFAVEYDTSQRVTNSASLEHDVRARVTKSVALEHDTRMKVSPAKVFKLKYDILKRVSKSFISQYGVRVPIASDLEFEVVYDARIRVTKTASLVYDTGVIGNTSVSTEFELLYHTLTTPTVDEVITVPVNAVSVPPQIVTVPF